MRSAPALSSSGGLLSFCSRLKFLVLLMLLMQPFLDLLLAPAVAKIATCGSAHYASLLIELQPASRRSATLFVTVVCRDFEDDQKETDQQEGERSNRSPNHQSF